MRRILLATLPVLAWVVVWSSVRADCTVARPIVMIPGTGQSASRGENGSPAALTTSQPYTNIMFVAGIIPDEVLTSWVPLVESVPGISQPGVGETGGAAMANRLRATNTTVDYLVALHGHTGYDYSQEAKGTATYALGMEQIEAGVRLASRAGRPFTATDIRVVHGEADHLTTAYAANIIQWRSDYDADIKARTRQSATVRMWHGQPAAYSPNDVGVRILHAARFDAGLTMLVGPKYQCAVDSGPHLTSAAYRWCTGDMYGKAMLSGSSWRPLAPVSTSIVGAVVTATFNVPVGCLAFDTSLVGSQPNHGFEWSDDSGKTISSVVIASCNTVTVTLSGTPTTNPFLAYAYSAATCSTGAVVCGELRDTDSTTNTSGDHLWDYAVTFRDPVPCNVAGSTCS